MNVNFVLCIVYDCCVFIESFTTRYILMFIITNNIRTNYFVVSNYYARVITIFIIYIHI